MRKLGELAPKIFNQYLGKRVSAKDLLVIAPFYVFARCYLGAIGLCRVPPLRKHTRQTDRMHAILTRHKVRPRNRESESENVVRLFCSFLSQIAQICPFWETATRTQPFHFFHLNDRQDYVVAGGSNCAAAASSKSPVYTGQPFVTVDTTTAHHQRTKVPNPNNIVCVIFKPLPADQPRGMFPLVSPK